MVVEVETLAKTLLKLLVLNVERAFSKGLPQIKMIVLIVKKKYKPTNLVSKRNYIFMEMKK